jgi:hypothetical protein
MKATLGKAQTLQLLAISCFLFTVSAYNFTLPKLFDSSTFDKMNLQSLYKKVQKKTKQVTAPTITFPDSFEMVLSNNDQGLNLTEVIYMVSSNR